MKRVLLVAVLLGCGGDDPVVPGLPARPPESEGEITERTNAQGGFRILVHQSPGSPPCPMPGPILASHFDVNNSTEIVARHLNGALRRFPADSVRVGRSVRAWARGTAQAQGCPPQYLAEAIEVLP